VAVLDQAHLTGKLREFSDPRHEQFVGYSTHRDQARDRWAAAFFSYFDQVEEEVTPAMPGHGTMNTGKVESAFRADLGLAESISAADTAADFAGAWKAGVEAVTPGGTITDGALATYGFISFNNVTAQHATLLASLEDVFGAPSGGDIVAQLEKISLAFQIATDGLMAAVTITPSGGPPASGTMGIK
jgi:hypothetical protein